MRLIISPAKKMKEDTDTLVPLGLPVFLDNAEEIMRWMKTLSFEESRKLWDCNEKIAELNVQRLAKMELRRGLTPAILSYEGIQYQYMAPAVFEDGAWEYVESHLAILSGFYGMLRPFDGVVPYRLEMQAKIHLGDCRDLYRYWGGKICQETIKGADTVLNLASKEYSKCISPFLPPGIRLLACRFGELREGKVIEKGTQVKMARGEMVRFLAQNGIEDTEGVKNFHGLGYQYEEKFSDNNTYVFLKSDSK